MCNSLSLFCTTPNGTLRWETEHAHISHITAGVLKINGQIQTQQLHLQIEPCVNHMKARRADFIDLSSCFEPVNSYSREVFVLRKRVCRSNGVCRPGHRNTQLEVSISGLRKKHFRKPTT